LRKTNIVEHIIPLLSNAKPIKAKGFRYSPSKIEFTNVIFSAISKASIIVPSLSEWGTTTLFPLKKPSSLKKRIVHNFKPVNFWTIKSSYPMHNIDEVIRTVIKPKYKVYFSTNAANGYWAIRIYPPDIYKVRVISPHNQFLYTRIG